jgi:hypothetical protein
MCFPEIDLDKSDKPRGMNVTVVTTAGKDETALEVLALLGMPFKRQESRWKKNADLSGVLNFCSCPKGTTDFGIKLRSYINYGHNSVDRENAKAPEVCGALSKPVPALWPSAGVLSRFWFVPDLFSESGPARGNPRRDQVQLVKRGETKRP